MRPNLSARAVVTAALFAASAHAQFLCGTTWKVSLTNGDWFKAANWSSGVPSGAVNACIQGGDPVNVAGNSNVLNLQVANNTLTIDGSAASSSLTLAGASLDNSGAIDVNAGTGGGAAALNVGGAIISGGGAITLSSSAANTASLTGGATLTNQDNTIQGGGTISAGKFVNGYIVDANNGTLTIAASSMTNGGVLRASAGTLVLGQVIDNHAGSIFSLGGGQVQLNFGTSIRGGNLNGDIEVKGPATLDGATNGALTNSLQGTVTVNDGTSLSLMGTIHNNGRIIVNSTSSGAGLNIAANTTLDGGGTLTLGTSQNAPRASISGAGTLDNVNNIIQGTGVVSAALTNETFGNVYANVNGKTLTLSGPVTNQGVLEAMSGGTLELSGTVNNSGGYIGADNQIDSQVTLLSTGTIQGGTLFGKLVVEPAISSGFGGTLDGATNGALTNTGAIEASSSGVRVLGTIHNQGSITLAASLLALAGNTLLDGNGTISGIGSFALSNGPATLTNVDNILEGGAQAGTQSLSGLTILNGGVIDANVNGRTLYLNGTGGVTNTGMIEATNGGSIAIFNSVNNAGGTISTDGAPGSTVTLFGGSTVTGGALSGNVQIGFFPLENAAILDGSVAGGVTNNGTLTVAADSNYLTLRGALHNNGAVALAGGNGYTQLFLDGNTTFDGGGTVTLSHSNPVNANAVLLGYSNLDNVNNTIQGAGHIGNGLSMSLTNEAGGVVNANSNGQTLFLDGTGGVANSGILQATNGGTLQIATTVMNQNGTIQTDSGNGSVVQLSGGTIQGRLLNGAVTTTAGDYSSTLDGSTAGPLTNRGAITVVDNSALNIQGAIHNTGSIALNTVFSGATLNLSADATLSGGGQVILSDPFAFGNNAITGNATLTNADNLIIGAGHIGNGSALTILNGGTIEASTSVSPGGIIPGNTMFIDSTANITNTGTLKADSGSTLSISSNLTNFNGTTLSGGTYVALDNATLQIASLGISGGEIFHNNAAIMLLGANSNILDGAGNDALSNLQDNQAGGTLAIANGRNFFVGDGFNNSGAIQVGDNSALLIAGNIHNAGSIAMSSNGNLSQLFLFGSATLAGGGTVTLSDSNSAISGFTGGTLENVDNTIQGAGHIGNGGLGPGYSINVVNDAGGTILANSSAARLVIDPGGSFTNLGTLEAGPGATLELAAPGNYFGAGTLKAIDGTIQIDNPPYVQSNAATVVLSGVDARIVDSLNNNALFAFADNLAAGAFTIENGANFTASASFDNAGTLLIGVGSIFTAPDYDQSGGRTEVNGTLTATNVNIDGGALAGVGTVNGSVNIGANGTIDPGDAPGAIQLNGDLIVNGEFQEDIAGDSASGMFGSADVNGSITLGSSSFFDVFTEISLPSTPGFHDSYVVLDATGGINGHFGSVQVNGLSAGDTFALDYSHADEVILDIAGPGQTSTPEPSPFLLVLAIAIALVGWKIWKNRRANLGAAGIADLHS